MPHLRLTLMTACFAVQCRADVIVNQPLLNAFDRGAFSVYGQQELADQFTLSAPVALHGLTWYGSFWQTDLSPTTTQYPFVVRIFETTTASDYGQMLGDPTTAAATPFYQSSVLATVAPSGIPFSGTDLGGDSSNRITYQFAFEGINDLTLAPLTEYWISILAQGPTLWRWANSNSGSLDYSVYRFVYLGQTDWEGFSNAPVNLPVGPYRGDMAFSLSGTTVPEPSTFVLTLSVVVAIGFRQDFKKRPPLP